MVLQRWSPRRTMTAWRPFQELEEMEQRFEDLFGRSFMPVWRRSPSSDEWMPSIDMYEKDDKLIVKAELPGMKMEDIDVSVTDSNLTIKGEKKSSEEIKEDDYYRSECTYGSFYRSIPLPSNVDADKVEADYMDGILEVSIPKIPEAQPKKIKVAAKTKKGS